MVSKSLIFLSYILGTRSVAGHTRRTGLAIARLIRILMSSPGGPNQEVRFFLGLGTRAVRPTPERPGASLGYNDEISRVCLCAANSGLCTANSSLANQSINAALPRQLDQARHQQVAKPVPFGRYAPRWRIRQCGRRGQPKTAPHRA